MTGWTRSLRWCYARPLIGTLLSSYKLLDSRVPCEGRPVVINDRPCRSGRAPQRSIPLRAPSPPLVLWSLPSWLYFETLDTWAGPRVCAVCLWWSSHAPEAAHRVISRRTGGWRLAWWRMSVSGFCLPPSAADACGDGGRHSGGDGPPGPRSGTGGGVVGRRLPLTAACLVRNPGVLFRLLPAGLCQGAATGVRSEAFLLCDPKVGRLSSAARATLSTSSPDLSRSGRSSRVRLCLRAFGLRPTNSIESPLAPPCPSDILRCLSRPRD